jgi:hypothetical protein
VKQTVATLAALCFVSSAALVGCSSDPMKKATEAMEAVAAQAEKAGTDCDKFVAAAKPIAEKNLENFKKVRETMKGEKDEAMKKFAEYAPRLMEVRKKMKPLKAACRQHEGAKAVMAMLRGK